MTEEQGTTDMKETLSPGKHGVIIIHGIGEQKKGDILAEFANSLAVSLKECGGDVHVQANIDSDQASATLIITPPNSKETATWICKEAYWADSFRAPAARQVMGLIFSRKYFPVVCRRFLRVLTCVRLVARDPLNGKFGPGAKDTAKEPVTVWQRVVVRPLVITGHVLMLVLLPFFSAVGILLLLIYWLFGWIIDALNVIPLLKPLDAVVGWLHKNVDPVFSNSIGDLSQYFEHTFWAASIRHRLATVVIDMLRDDEKADDKEKIQDITIVAHSMGCLVAYEVLSEDGEVAEELKHPNKVEGKSKARRKKMSLVTVGSALNLAFDMATQPKASQQAKDRINRPLAPQITGYDANSKTDTFFWLDMHARVDPVPAGYMYAKIIDTNENSLSRGHVELRRVMNMDDLFCDHTGYFDNKELVMPRIAKAINGGNYPWPGSKPERQKVVKRVSSASKFGILRGIALFGVVDGALIFASNKLTGVEVWLIVIDIALLSVFAWLFAKRRARY